MEKRLLWALLLSMGVMFVFQVAFPPRKTSDLDLSQQIENKDVITSTQTADVVKKDTVTTPSSPSASFQEEIFSTNGKSFDIDFTNKGGNIKRLKIREYAYDVLPTQFANLKGFEDKPFKHTQYSDTYQAMTYDGDGWSVSKEYREERPFIIEETIQIKNTSTTPKAMAPGVDLFVLDLSSLDKKDFGSDWTLFEYSIKKDNKIVRKDNAHNFNEKWNKSENQGAEWMAFRDRYFATIVQPKIKTDKYSIKTIDEKRLAMGGDFPAVIVNPGQTIEYSFTIYAGPQKLDVLSAAKPGFEKVMVFSNWGWLDAIAKAIYWLLGTLHKVLPVWGLCIILVSFIVYILMYPLTLKSLQSMKKMQALQPKMAEIKKKYEKNPEKMNQEVMELYRRNGVNPLSGCLPMLLQMPIFVGLYQVLWRSFYFRGEGFLWMKDLSKADHLFKLPVTIPFLGEYFNILPILMAVIMFVQQKMSMVNMPSGDSDQQMQQKMMMIFMPVFLGFIFYNFSSGLNLYFVVFYTMSAYTQWHVGKNMKAVI